MAASRNQLATPSFPLSIHKKGYMHPTKCVCVWLQFASCPFTCLHELHHGVVVVVVVLVVIVVVAVLPTSSIWFPCVNTSHFKCRFTMSYTTTTTNTTCLVQHAPCCLFWTRTPHFSSRRWMTKTTTTGTGTQVQDTHKKTDHSPQVSLSLARFCGMVGAYWDHDLSG